MSEKLQKTLHRDLETMATYGVDDAFTEGYVTAMSHALHAIVADDGTNHTGCQTFDTKQRSGAPHES
jgi:hypothetical protein